jgi:hypothetical protein
MNALSISSPYGTLEEALAALTAVEQTLRARQDRRAIFTTAYLVITGAIQRQIQAGWFSDNQWVDQYAIRFANLYREALLAYESGNLGAVPKAWRLSFDTSLHNRGLLIQDLVLGINAHINHDLALALVDVGIDPDRGQRYHDHTRVNEILQAATDRLQDQVCDLYAPILRLLDLAGGRLDEELASFSVGKARESAWLTAVALANTANASERDALRSALNDRAAVLARLILSPNPLHPWLIEALRRVERLNPWTQCLTLSTLELADAPQPRVGPA